LVRIAETKKLRKTDAVLLGVWKAASRLEQAPQRTQEEGTPAQPAATPPATPSAAS
jgi:hypothetical protein